jgi:hypothetical protein
MVQSKVNVKCQSHVMTDGQLLSMSWRLDHAALEGLHPNEFQSDIRRGILRRNFYVTIAGGPHVKHAVQRGILVPTPHLFWGQGIPRKTLIELVGRRTFRMQTEF